MARVAGPRWRTFVDLGMEPAPFETAREFPFQMVISDFHCCEFQFCVQWRWLNRLMNMVETKLAARLFRTRCQTNCPFQSKNKAKEFCLCLPYAAVRSAALRAAATFELRGDFIFLTHNRLPRRCGSQTRAPFS